jgi:cardiolipin synthase
MFGTSPVFSITIIVFYMLGFMCAASAILRARTPQGATAWVIGLITLPFFTVPIFFIFGRSKFYGYTNRRRMQDEKIGRKLERMQEVMKNSELTDNQLHPLMNSLAKLSSPGFTTQNKVELLIDGKQTYQSMLEALEKAEKYIIFQFYVFRADKTGKTFADVLMRKARQGVQVNFLYDEIGTEIPDAIINDMKSAGIDVCHFNSLRGKGRFQINFRNHRKILIVDGKVSFVGGLNIGDDYLGLWPDLGPWRDTHVRMEGPSVIACQMVHAKDWYWCKQEDLNADWQIKTTDGDANVLILPSGPADEKQNCLLAHIAMVNSAVERLWIANPYLVPPESLLDAILLAALRGVDVRFILPSYSDAWIVMIASEVYVSRLLKHGVKVYRYRGGFLHQKVMLVDNLFAVVGSANLDFRSMFINFEITVVGQETKFVDDVSRMLERDILNSREVSLLEYEDVSLWKKITSRTANLFAPML